MTTHSKSRIALVTKAMSAGGVEIYLLRLGAYLCRQGFHVDLITTEAQGVWFERITQHGMGAVHVAGYHPWQTLAHSRRVGQQLVQGGYDVVFINNTIEGQLALPLLPAQTIAIPVLHGDINYYYDRFCANAAAWNAVVAVSPKIQQEAQRRYAHRPIVYLPNGVEIPSPSALRDRQPFAIPLHLLYLGRLDEEQKGVLYLPDLLRRCADAGMDARLTVAGDGPDRESLREHCESHGVQDRVTFLGAVTPSRAYELYLTHHVFVMPSRWEGLPTVLLEAQACGCVPVASRLPGITDVAAAEGKTALLVDIGDMAGMCEAIHVLYADQARWLAMSQAGQRKVACEFSIEKMGQGYVQLIHECREGRYALPHGERASRSFDVNFLSALVPFGLGYHMPPWVKSFVRVLRQARQK